MALKERYEVGDQISFAHIDPRSHATSIQYNRPGSEFVTVVDVSSFRELEHKQPKAAATLREFWPDIKSDCPIYRLRDESGAERRIAHTCLVP